MKLDVIAVELPNRVKFQYVEQVISSGIPLILLSGYVDLMRAFATRLIERGANIRAVQELLGHCDLATTAVYLGLAPKFLKEAIRRFENTKNNGKPEIDDVTQSIFAPKSLKQRLKLVRSAK